MNQKKCQNCGFNLTSKVRFCPECGTPVAPSDRASSQRGVRRRSNRRTNKRDLLIIVGFLLIVTLGYFTFKETEAVPQRPESEVLSHEDIPFGDMDESMKMLGDLPTDYTSLVALGNELMDQFNYPFAAECYKRALAIESDSLDVRVDYGACLHGMGLTHRAIEEFRKAIETNPSHPIAHFNLGIVYHGLNEIDSARIYWQKYLAIDPDGKAAEATRALLKEIGG